MNGQLFADAVEVRELVCGVTHERELVRRLIDEWHSVLTAPQGWKVAFLLSAGNTIVGVATLGRPVARLEDQETTLELTRMALHNAPHNSASRFMGLIRRWLRAHMPEVKRLISYQDCDYHVGTMYRVDNWKLVYEQDGTRHSWTNRAGRLGNERKHRAKWERMIVGGR